MYACNKKEIHSCFYAGQTLGFINLSLSVIIIHVYKLCNQKEGLINQSCLCVLRGRTFG
jgi:hypothetical protein